MERVWAIWRQKSYQKLYVHFCFKILTVFLIVYGALNAQEDTGVSFHRKLNSILRRDHQKNFIERRAYESVDERSLS